MKRTKNGGFDSTDPIAVIVKRKRERCSRVRERYFDLAMMSHVSNRFVTAKFTRIKFRLNIFFVLLINDSAIRHTQNTNCMLAFKVSIQIACHASISSHFHIDMRIHAILGMPPQQIEFWNCQYLLLMYVQQSTITRIIFIITEVEKIVGNKKTKSIETHRLDDRFAYLIHRRP